MCVCVYQVGYRSESVGPRDREQRRLTYALQGIVVQPAHLPVLLRNGLKAGLWCVFVQRGVCVYVCVCVRTTEANGDSLDSVRCIQRSTHQRHMGRARRILPRAASSRTSTSLSLGARPGHGRQQAVSKVLVWCVGRLGWVRSAGRD